MPATAFFVLLALAGATGLAGWIVARQPAPVRRQLLIVCFVAIALRVGVGVLLNLLGTWQITERGAISPDDAVIDYAASLIAGGDERSPGRLGGSPYTSWLIVASSVYELGNSLVTLKLVNALLGTLLVIPCFLLGRELHSDRAGLLAAWGVALFPNAIVWSSLALREPLIVLLLTTLILIGVRIVANDSRPSRHVALAGLGVVCLVILAFTRAYMVPLMLALMLITGAVAALCRRTLSPLGPTLTVGVLAVALVIALPNGLELTRATLALGSGEVASIYNPLGACTEASGCARGESEPASPATRVVQGGLSGTDRPRARSVTDRRGNADADAARSGGPRSEDFVPRPGSTAGAASPSDSEQSVEKKGFVRAFAIPVLAGRPVWERTEFFFLLQPGVVVWWVLLPCMIAGAALLLRGRRLPAFVFLGGFCSSVVVFLAYTGQFIRHHYMIEAVALVIASVGVIGLLETQRPRVRRLAAAACAGMGLAATASVAASVL